MYLNRFEVWLCFIWDTVYKSAQTALVYNALQQIYSWMTANLLTLNSSKTEFLLIGLKKQLDKIHNSSLNSQPWLHLLRTSYTSPIQFQPSAKPAITTLDSSLA